MCVRAALLSIIALPAVPGKSVLAAGRGLAGLLKSHPVILIDIDRGDGATAQVTFWSEPVLMLMLGLALFIAATSIRRWGKRRIKAAANRMFQAANENGKGVPVARSN